MSHINYVSLMITGHIMIALFCENIFLDDLRSYLFSFFFQATIKKLVTVTEMLSKHKQKYLEMIR
jgi:hypothetical protein